MIQLVDTSYKISGDDQNRRNGAIAMNALLASLRGMGRDQLPILDRDYQIFSMIHAGLNGLDVGEIATPPTGSLVAANQARKNPALDKIDAGMEKALGLLDDDEIEPVVRSKKVAA